MTTTNTDALTFASTRATWQDERDARQRLIDAVEETP